MKTSAAVAVGIVSVAVLAGLTALAVPAFSAIGAAADSFGTFADPPQPTDQTSSTVDDVPAVGNTTDYSKWSEAELAAARAEDPHPTIINHPSRFAGDCLQNSSMTERGTLQGAREIVDMGATEFADGEVTRNADGLLALYTVAPGDAGMAIGERFCVDYVTLFQYNDIYPAPHPGDVILLLPLGRP